MGKIEEEVWVHFEKGLTPVPIYSVLSVYSVVLAGKLTTEHTENTEKTLKKKIFLHQVNSNLTGTFGWSYLKAKIASSRDAIFVR